MKSNTMKAMAAAGILAAGFAGPVLAQEMLSGTDAIEKRQELMKSNGMSMKTIATTEGEDQAAAQTLIDNFTELQDLFPEDSMEGADTEALPSVWEDREGFDVALNNALTAAQDLLAATQEGDVGQESPAFQAMGKTCGGCHQDYRVDDD